MCLFIGLVGLSPSSDPVSIGNFIGIFYLRENKVTGVP